MHVINVSREEIEGCYRVELDGKFVVSTPSKQLAGDRVIELLDKAGEVCLVGLVDNGPANRDKRERALAQRRGHEAARAAARVSAGRSAPEPWRP